MGNHIGGLTEREATALVELLRKVEQPYSRDLTEALARLMPVVTVELVVMRMFGGERQVLLTQRPQEPGDPWAGAIHLPGTVVRNSDDSMEAALHRLAKAELGIPLETWRFVYERHHRGGGRPSTFQHVYRATVREIPTKGEWYDLADLPHALLPLHVKIIAAVEHMVFNDGH